MTLYRTGFQTAMASLAKTAFTEKPSGECDYALGYSDGRQSLAAEIGFALANTDARPWPSDWWESEVEHWEERAKKAEELAKHLERVCGQYAGEVFELKEQIKAMKGGAHD